MSPLRGGVARVLRLHVDTEGVRKQVTISTHGDLRYHEGRSTSAAHSSLTSV